MKIPGIYSSKYGIVSLTHSGFGDILVTYFGNGHSERCDYSRIKTYEVETIPPRIADKLLIGSTKEYISTLNLDKRVTKFLADIKNFLKYGEIDISYIHGIWIDSIDKYPDSVCVNIRCHTHCDEEEKVLMDSETIPVPNRLFSGDYSNREYESDMYDILAYIRERKKRCITSHIEELQKKLKVYE